MSRKLGINAQNYIDSMRTCSQNPGRFAPHKQRARREEDQLSNATSEMQNAYLLQAFLRRERDRRVFKKQDSLRLQRLKGTITWSSTKKRKILQTPCPASWSGLIRSSNSSRLTRTTSSDVPNTGQLGEPYALLRKVLVKTLVPHKFERFKHAFAYYVGRRLELNRTSVFGLWWVYIFCVPRVSIVLLLLWANSQE